MLPIGFLKRTFFLGILWAAFVLTIQAQYRIESWSTDDGLPQNTIYSILQTADGYLWMTTSDGLVRYDGVNFKVFNRSTKGIEGNRFTQLLVDREGTLWAGTEENGVTRYRDGVFQTFEIPENTLKKPIRNLVVTDDGAVAAVTTLDVFKWNGEKFIRFDPDAGETRKKLSLSDKFGHFTEIQKDSLPEFKGLKIGDYFSSLKNSREIDFTNFFEDSRGRIWIGTKNAGLFLLEKGQLTAYGLNQGLPSDSVKPQLEDREGNIWLTSSKGAAIIESDNKLHMLTTEQGLSNNDVSAIYEDREGNIWIGTLFKGLNRINKQSVKFYSQKNGLQANKTLVIFQDKSDDIWIGGTGLTLFHNGQFSAVPGREKFYSKQITAIAQDHTGRIWFGSWGGVSFLENGVFSSFSDQLSDQIRVLDIHEDRNGTVWFASDDGLYRYKDGATERINSVDAYISSGVKLIHESPDGTLWLGTVEGLLRYREDRQEFSLITKKDGLSSERIRSIYEDSDGVLWIGTYDGGLNRLKNGQITSYTSENGLFNDGVFQIIEDSGEFWMSSNRGIYRVAKQQLNDFADGKISRITSTAYDKSDGLLETECNGGQQPAGIKASDGRLWFPTQGGVAVIDPKSIKTNPLAPPVVIESFLLNDKSFPAPEGAIEVPPTIENLEINYTGLSFAKPSQVTFKYKLEGWDSDWTEPKDSRRTAYYSHLAPGDYTFTVIAANSDGVWNNQGASIRVRVIPPFYRTWWFLTVLSLAAILTVFLLYRWRITRLERARRLQEDFSRKLLASQENERQRIAAELHDSIGQSLLIIKNRAFLALSDIEEREVVREQLEELSESATEAIEECREISYNLRPYQINRFGLTKTLEAIFRRIPEVSKIETMIEIDPIDNLFSAEAETNIYRIVQESVNNILKHSQASEALFVVKAGNAEVEILIRDNGSGFDQNSATVGNGRGGFGLIGMSERVRMLGGYYEIESTPGEGTLIKIKLNVNQNIQIV